MLTRLVVADDAFCFFIDVGMKFIRFFACRCGATRLEHPLHRRKRSDTEPSAPHSPSKVRKGLWRVKSRFATRLGLTRREGFANVRAEEGSPCHHLGHISPQPSR